MSAPATLRYGASVLHAELPPGIDWRPVPDPPAGGRGPVDPLARFASPEGAEPLDRFLAGASRVGVVVPDRTRPAGLERVLPALAHALDRVVPDAQVTIFVGGGTHRPGDASVVTDHLPAAFAARASIRLHDARDPASLVPMGRTSRGTDVTLHRELPEQDRIVAVGGVSYHYFAGFSGGRKAIFPGLGGYESIRQNHRLILSESSGESLAAACAPGRLAGNPIHLDALEAAALLPVPVFGVHVLTDATGGIEDVRCGDLVESHARACDDYARVHATHLAACATVVVADAGGHPRDIDLVQTHKALVHLAPVLEDGARLILVAACPEGIGSETFLRWFDGRSVSEIAEAMRAEYTLNAHTALSWRRQAERLDVRLVTELPADVCRRIGVRREVTLADALGSIADGLPPGAVGYVLRSPLSTRYVIDPRRS